MMKRLLFMLAFLVSFGFAAVGQESVDPSNEESSNNTEQNEDTPSDSQSFTFENGIATVIMDGTKPLNELLTGYEDQIKQLIISGRLSEVDFSEIRSLNNINVLDLRSAILPTQQVFLEDQMTELNYVPDLSGKKTLQKVYLPSTTHFITSFNQCSSLLTVNWTDLINLVYVGDFTGCTSLTNVDLHLAGSLRSMGNFGSCSNLTSVNFSGCQLVEEMGYFCYCSNLTTADFSNCTSLRRIGSQCFRENHKLSDLRLNNCPNIEQICYWAFLDCVRLTTFPFEQFTKLKEIEDNSFYRAGLTGTITFKEGLMSLGADAFYGCGITSVTFDNCANLLTLQNGAFSNWLQTIKFINCNQVELLTVSALKDYSNLEAIEINNTHYSTENGVLYNADKTEIIFYPVGKNNTVFTIPASVTTIKESAFVNNNYLQKVTIPLSVSSIEKNAFSNLNNDLKVYIENPNPIVLTESIGLENAAIYVPSNEALTAYKEAEIWKNYDLKYNNLISETVEIALNTEGKLEDYLIRNNINPSEITKLILSGPLNDNDIDQLRLMKNLVMVDMLNATVPENRFPGCFCNYMGDGPENLREVILPATTEYIGSMAFATLQELTTVVLPSTLKSIENEAFWACKALSEIHLENTVIEYISNDAFYLCESLPSALLLPNTIKGIGYNAFSSTNISSVEFDNTQIETIGDRAFASCNLQGDLVFPSTLSYIGDNAFASSHISSIRLSHVNMVTLGGQNVFKSVDKTDFTVYVPKNLVKQYKDQTYWLQFANNIQGFGALISVTSNDDRWGHIVTGGGAYESGEVITLQATPATDYWDEWNLKYIHFFVGWFENGELMSSDSEYTFTVGESDRNLQAIFEDLEIDIEYPIYEIIQVKKNNTSITLDINRVSENYDYIFTGWYENDRCISDNKQVTINIDPTGNTSSRTIEAKLSFGSGSLGNTVIDDNNKINGQTLFIYDGVTIEGDLTWKPDRINLSWSKSSLVVNSPIQANEIRLAAEDSDLAQDRITDWLFISFPYDLKVNEIDAEGNLFVVRYYDGEKRALEGPTSSWKQLGKDETMKANQGYIFKTNASSNRSAASFNTNVSAMHALFNRSAVTIPLQKHESVAMPDANWNLIGNPFPCYFRTKSLFEEGGLDGTITVWDSDIQNYQYYTQDDDAYIAPLTAFFVQHNQATSVTFHPEGRAAKLPEGTTRSASTLRSSDGRQVLNLVLSNDSLSDKTRIVFNEAAKAGYELGLDASKFRSMNPNAPAFYSIDADNQQLAINERPWDNGVVRLGCNFGVKGEYSIALQEAVEQDLILVDKVTGAQTNLKEQAYRFSAEVGESNDRFELRSGNPTGMEEMAGFQWQVRGGQLFLTGLPTHARVIVHDTMGRTVCDRTVSDELSSLALPQAGVYYLTIRTQQATRTERIMVKE